MDVARGLLLDEVLQGACFARHRESTLHSDSSGANVRDSTLYSADFQSAFRLTQLGFLALDEVLQGVLGEAQSAFRLTGGVTQRGVLVPQGDACAVRVSGMEREPLQTLAGDALQQRLREKMTPLAQHFGSNI